MCRFRLKSAYRPHHNFRLWLSSKQTHVLPSSVVQSSIKVYSSNSNLTVSQFMITHLFSNVQVDTISILIMHALNYAFRYRWNLPRASDQACNNSSHLKVPQQLINNSLKMKTAVYNGDNWYIHCVCSMLSPTVGRHSVQQVGEFRMVLVLWT